MRIHVLQVQLLLADSRFGGGRTVESLVDKL